MPAKPWLKAELHTHVQGDPIDTFIRYSAYDLIDRAAALDFRVLAITCHNYIFRDEAAKTYAHKKGIVLIRGLEMTLQGKHTLIYNITPEQAAEVKTFHDLAALKEQHPEIFVIAPHPYHHAAVCLDDLVLKYPTLFDAWEYSFFYTRSFNPNEKTMRLAKQLGKPVVGNSDVHDRQDLGRTYTLINSEPTEKDIFAAIRDGKLKVVTRPLSVTYLGSIVANMVYRAAKRKILGKA